MEFSTRWDAVFNPHIGTRYFDRCEEIPFPAGCDGFSAAAAWWLAELSRWIYNQDPAPGGSGSARSAQHAHLERAGLVERLYLSVRGTRVALITTRATSRADGFAVLVFQGSTGPLNWIDNLLAVPNVSGRHFGYARALARVWPELVPRLRALDVPLYLTGHSLGGALAALAALEMPDAVAYTFGAPPSASADEALPDVFPGAFRVVNYRDLATRVTRGSRFRHIGTLCYISRSGALWQAPSAARVFADLGNGTRPHTRELNRGHSLAIPEAVSDHAPINYVAHLERIALASGAGRVPE